MLLNCREFNHPSVANVYVSYIRRKGSDTARGLSRKACRERCTTKVSSDGINERASNTTTAWSGIYLAVRIDFFTPRANFSSATKLAAAKQL